MSSPPQNNNSLLDVLGELERKNGLRDLRFENDCIQKYISISSENIENLSKAQVKGICLDLCKYSLHLANLSSEYNAGHIAIGRIIDVQVAKAAAKLLQENKFLSFEERKKLAIAQDPELCALHDEFVEKEMCYNRISKLIFSVNELIKRIESYVEK